MISASFNMIFDPPRIVWSVNSEPYFILNLQQSLTGLVWDRYQLLVDGELKGVVFPEQNSVFSLLYPIKIKCRKPRVNVKLITSSEHILCEYDLELWDTSRKISIYNQYGILLSRRIERYQGRTPFYAIVESELKMPVDGQRMVYLNQEWSLHHLNSQELYELENLLGPGLLWLDDGSNITIKTDEKSKENELLYKIRQVTMHADRDIIPRLGEAIPFIISVPGQSCQVLKILYGGKSVNFIKDGPRYVTAPIMVKELKPEFKIYILYNGTDKYCLKKWPRVNFRGASLIKREEQAVLNKRHVIEKEALIQNPLQVHLPANWRQKEDRQKLRIMEGYRILADVRNAPQLLKSVGGFGAPLLIKRPYNSKDKLVIVREIQDRGIIKDIQWDAQKDKMQIKFNCSYEIGQDHRLLIWSPPCNLQEVSRNMIEQGEDSSIYYIPIKMTPEIAVIISYRGLRVGSWWGVRFFQTLLQTASQASSKITIAALLRWGRFPIVSSQLHHFVQYLLKSHLDDILAAWLLDEGLPEGLKHVPVSEGEQSALRYYLLDLRLERLNELMLSRYFLKPLGQTVDEIVKYLRWCSLKINDISPLLYADLVRRNVRRVKADQGVIAARELVFKLETEILKLKHPNKINEELDKLGQLASKEANVDYFFIRNGIVRRALDWIYQLPLGNWSRPNILAACSFPYLRKYLCVSLIHTAYN